MVSSIDGEYVYIDTVDGNGWVVDYVDVYEIGEDVLITFEDMGTEDIYDDEILKIRKVER